MNLIPFLLIFMTAISFYSGYLLKSSKSYLKQLVLLESSYHTEQTLFYNAEKTYFYYQPGKINLPKRKEYINFRENEDLYERSKCNLKPCFETKIGREYLKKALTSFYPDIFADESIAEDLIDALKNRYKLIKEEKIPITLYQLVPEDKNIKNLYLELLKNSAGPLAFSKLFFIEDKAHQKPLCFRYAKMPLFSLALGRQLSDSLLHFEKESFLNPDKKLKVEQVKNFFLDQGLSDEDAAKLLSYFSFKEPKKTWIHLVRQDNRLGAEASFLRQVIP